MRLFFAVELPEEIREKLFLLSREISGKGVRAVARDNLHITLKFLGEKTEAECKGVAKKASGIVFEPFSVGVAGVGAFPNEKFPRAIWAGANARELGGLAGMLEESIGLSKESFTGHITLARIGGKVNLAEFFSLHKSGSFGSFTCNSFCLKKSELSPQGPKYGAVSEFPLRLKL